MNENCNGKNELRDVYTAFALLGQLLGFEHLRIIGRQTNSKSLEDRAVVAKTQVYDRLLGQVKSLGPAAEASVSVCQIAKFAKARCRLGPGLETTKDELFQAYLTFCQAEDGIQRSREYFFRKLYSACPNIQQVRPRINGRRELRLRGLGLLDK